LLPQTFSQLPAEISFNIGIFKRNNHLLFTSITPNLSLLEATIIGLAHHLLPKCKDIDIEDKSEIVCNLQHSQILLFR
jgi:hypothetical protein